MHLPGYCSGEKTCLGRAYRCDCTCPMGAVHKQVIRWCPGMQPGWRKTWRSFQPGKRTDAVAFNKISSNACDVQVRKFVSLEFAVRRHAICGSSVDSFLGNERWNDQIIKPKCKINKQHFIKLCKICQKKMNSFPNNWIFRSWSSAGNAAIPVRFR